MTNQQGAPEALRLADALYDGSYLLSVERYTTADELRRLHAENERLAALVEAQQPACDTARYCQSVQRCTAKDESRAQQPVPSAAAQIDSALNDYAQAFVARVNGWTKQNGDDLPVARAVLFQAITDYARELAMAASQPSPTPQADSVLEDADPIRALIAEHAAILAQNESAYFELCYHRATGWMAWITDKPLCMPPVVNPDRKVLAHGQGDTADEACRDAARKQGGA